MSHPNHNDPQADFWVSNHGSIALLGAASTAAAEWAEEHLGEEPMRHAGAYVIEPRYLPAILQGIAEAGLTVD